jgi:type I restriction enzyme M protein
MIWIAPSENDTATGTLEKRLWDAADQFRANSGLKSQEYSAPVLGLIFLRFAEVRFAAERAKLLPSPSGRGTEGEGGVGRRRGNRSDDPTAYHAEGILYLPAEARFDYLLNRPEAENIGAKVDAAMHDVTKLELRIANCEIQSVRHSTLAIRTSPVPASMNHDAFGRICEYFLGEFAMSEGQGGGEFYTPSSIVRLLTEVIEPYHGRILGKTTLRLAQFN